MTNVTTIQHSEDANRGEFYFERDGERLAKMTYSRSTPTLVIVDHTEVSDVLKGQGMGRQLLDALVAWARQTGTKVMATCPYALAQFRKDESTRDVFAG
jgi:predicted GNAT family acetyltransferase